METLLSQKGQLSQVSSMLTHAAPVAILSSGDKIGNWERGKLWLAALLCGNWLSPSCFEECVQSVTLKFIAVAAVQ